MLRLLIRWGLVALCLWLVTRLPGVQEAIGSAWSWFYGRSVAGQLMLGSIVILVLVAPMAVSKLRRMVLDMYE